MKFLAYASLLVAPLMATMGAAINKDNHYYKQCQKVSQDHVHAIDNFCKKPNGAIMLPSGYAKNGVQEGKVWVSIDATCSPKSWLPEGYCQRQFWQLCSNTALSGGWGRQDFGDGGCQHFLIQEAS